MIRLLLLATFAALLATASRASDLVIVESGELPIILTAPHGGQRDVPGCEVRTPIGPRFVNRPDHNTDRLARMIADEIKRLTGKTPYLVMAQFHRKYIDANRRAEEAYGDPGCAAHYTAYHAAIRGFVDGVRAKYPHAMLFDIHGQTAYRSSILRGTRQGSTVQALLARAGAPAVTGPDSVFGQFAAMGYHIVPANDIAPTQPAEAKNYAGGHTVDLYGSQRSNGIDTMQLEFGRDFRDNAPIGQMAQDTAKAIAAFYARYLK
jgi:N-formylglutamate amidohydrolase